MAYDSYKKTYNPNNTKPKDYMMEEKRQQIKYLYDMAADREDDCLLNGEPFKESPRITERTIRTNYYQTLFAISLNEKIISGDLLSYDNLDWLCTSAYRFHDLYYKGKFFKCNHTLKWQDSETLDINEYSCYCISAIQYNNGLTSQNNTFVLASDQLMISLPSNKDTLKLPIGKRFFIDKYTEKPTCYELTRNDTVPYSDWDNGCVCIVVTETQTNPSTDRIDLMLCDYVEDNREEDVNVNMEITYTSLSLKANGYSRKFNAVFTDADGNEVTGITPVWTLDCAFANDINMVQDGLSVKLSTDNEDLIAETFDLVLTCNESTKECRITIEIIEI